RAGEGARRGQAPHILDIVMQHWFPRFPDGADATKPLDARKALLLVNRTNSFSRPICNVHINYG
ncbi:MAG: hypothetical protein ABI963_02395, partial [Rhizomicrobium sp.]